jgi:predicted nucleic acid-binding protein
VSVVISDASPLHHLILCGAESILPSLFRQVVIPPTVFRELQQPNTPPPVRQWAASLPAWVAVQTPKTMNLKLDVDAGELEAICLAQEIHADAVDGRPRRTQRGDSLRPRGGWHYWLAGTSVGTGTH